MNKAATRTRAINRSNETVQLDKELSKVGISAMTIVSGLIGIWAMACMIGSLVESGGPLSLAKVWYSAVIGG